MHISVVSAQRYALFHENDIMVCVYFNIGCSGTAAYTSLWATATYDCWYT